MLFDILSLINDLVEGPIARRSRKRRTLQRLPNLESGERQLLRSCFDVAGTSKRRIVRESADVDRALRLEHRLTSNNAK